MPLIEGIPAPPNPYDEDGKPDPKNPGWSYYGYTDTGTGVLPGEQSDSSGNYQTKTCKLVIKYHANGAPGNPPSDSVKTYAGSKKAVKLTVSVKTQAPMSWTDHYFLGWALSSSSQSIAYHQYDTITKEWSENGSGTETYNLYAMWTTGPVIIYRPGSYANESGKAYINRYVKKPDVGQSIRLADKMFTRTGFDQVGWQTGLTPNTTYALKENYTSTDANNLNLYPVWQAHVHRVTFKPNGGDGSDRVEQVNYGDSFSVLREDYFHKEGYHIASWNEREDGKGTAWYPDIGYTFSRDEDITLYAHWEGNKYYVLYNDDEDGDGESRLNGIISYPTLDIDGNDRIYSSNGNLHLTDADILYTDYAAFIVDQSSSARYSVATYGSPFYTDQHPAPKEGYSFAGWIADDGTILTKQNIWMDAYSFSSDPIWTRQENARLTPLWSGDYPFGSFFYARKDSRDCGIVVEQPPDYYWPSISFKHEKVNARNGDMLTDPMRYDNVQKIYKIAAYNKKGFYKAASEVSKLLHRRYYTGDYSRIEDSYEPDVYMMGIYEESGKLENILDQAGRGTITFSCKPQKFLLSGNTEIVLTHDMQNLTNPTDFASIPILKIYGTGTVRVYGRPDRRLIGNDSELVRVDIKITQNFNCITLDCETYDAVEESGYNMNEFVTVNEPVRLYPGGNKITFDDSITRVIVIPRWWRL